MLMFLELTFPDISNFFGNGIIQGIGNLIEFIVGFFATTTDSLTQFYSTLSEINHYIVMWIASADGADTGLPVLASIGAYRYLVGEGAFYMTYLSLLCGCLFTIAKLTYMLSDLFKKLSDKINAKDSKTASGLLNLVTKFFSQNN